MAATSQFTGNFFEKLLAVNIWQKSSFMRCLLQLTLPTGLGPATVIARFIGEVMTMHTDLIELSVELGASIDAVSGDIPGRKITTSLVGRLPSL